MKSLFELTKGYEKPIPAAALLPKRTEEQQLAIDIAEHLSEKVGLWVGVIRRAKIRAWFIRAKFEELKKQNELESKAKARILMAFIRTQSKR